MSLTYDPDKHSAINENKNIENLENDHLRSEVHSVVGGLSEDEELGREDADAQESLWSSRKAVGLKELSALYSSCILEDNLSSLEDCITICDEKISPSDPSNVGQQQGADGSSQSTTTSSCESLCSVAREDLPHKGGSETSLFSGGSRYYSTESFHSGQSETDITKTLYDREDNYTESCPDISVKDKIRLDFWVGGPKMNMNAKSTPEKLDMEQSSKRKKSLISSFRKGRKGNRKPKRDVTGASESTDLASNEESIDLKSDEESGSVVSSVPSSSSERKLEDTVGIPSQDLEDEPAGSSGDRNEYLFKILVIGELGTGKTSIIKRYVHQFFSQHYRATIGVDFALKVLSWDSNTVIRLQLWDIAGQERFGNMTRVYYKEAVGAFIVFDVTRAQTFDCITKWKNDLDTKVTLPNGSPIPTVLLANKCDQPKEGIVNSPARMDEYCRDSGYVGWFETSAKENINIDEAAKFLVNQILCIEQNGLLTTDTYDEDKFSIDSPGRQRSSSEEQKCAC